MSTDARSLLAVAFSALACWIVALLLLAYRSAPAEAVMVWAPKAQLASMISASPVSVVDAEASGFVVLRGDAFGFVPQLYASGAWLVLPAPKRGGCLGGAGPRRA